MELYILRHGETSKKLYNFVDSNHSLTFSGKSEIEKIGKSIKKLKIKIDLILTSTISSSLETSDIINNLFSKKIKILKCKDLQPEGNILNVYKIISEFNQMSSILIVGHEPYLSTMISDIISNSNNKNKTNNDIKSNSNIILKKAGLSKIRITSTVPTLQGELRWLLTPRVLKSII